jgi:hypothetical protein
MNLNENLLEETEYYDFNEVDQSSVCSLESELESIDLNTLQYNIKRIKNNKSRPRINHGFYIGSLAFDIVWQDDSETREPIQNLIDIQTESINEFIIDTIEDYKQTAINYPTNNRCCLMCWQKVHNGNFLCNKHKSMYYFLNN